MQSNDIRDQIVAVYEQRMDDLAQQLTSGAIDIGSWQLEMRQETRDAFALQIATVTNGQATADDYLKLGSAIRSQDKYLSGFARDIHEGKVSPDAIASRAKMYARASRTMYSMAATDGVRLPTYPGLQQCHGNCLCEWRDNGDGSWTWDRTNEKGTSCDDCIHNAEIYNPYWPAGSQQQEMAA